jgi:hypothetical protein
MGYTFSLRVLHGATEYRSLLHTLLEVDRCAETMGWDMGILPYISRLLDTLAGKSIIKKSIF